MSNGTRENLHENDFVKGWVEDNIMFAEFKTKTLDFDAAKASVAVRVSSLKDKHFPTFIDARKVQSITKEARDYFASEEGSQNIIASALLIDSVVGKFMGNFFLQISKPKIPLRLFTNEAEALRWLKQFIKEQD
jgi:hypothetical protein